MTSTASSEGNAMHLEALLLRVSILELFALDGGRALSPDEVAYERQKARTETSR